LMRPAPSVTVPVPASTTVSRYVGGGGGAAGLNVAVTEVEAVMFTMHVLVPLHGLDQPANVEPAAAAAVRVTCVPLAKLALQVGPQLMALVLSVTVPVPVPASATMSWKVCGGGTVAAVNVAVTEVAAVMFTVQVPVPVHGLDQPANVEPVAAVAVSVTCEPPAKLALHADPQLMPAGALTIEPVPVPALSTVS